MREPRSVPSETIESRAISLSRHELLSIEIKKISNFLFDSASVWEFGMNFTFEFLLCIKANPKLGYWLSFFMLNWSCKRNAIGQLLLRKFKTCVVRAFFKHDNWKIMWYCCDTCPIDYTKMKPFHMYVFGGNLLRSLWRIRQSRLPCRVSWQIRRKR